MKIILKNLKKKLSIFYKQKKYYLEFRVDLVKWRNKMYSIGIDIGSVGTTGVLLILEDR